MNVSAAAGHDQRQYENQAQFLILRRFFWERERVSAVFNLTMA